MHIIICGRQGNEFDTDEETGELKKVGVKMKAEGETPYEPHILIRMESIKDPKQKDAIITAFAEKDRTGVLAGGTIAWPSYDNLVVPLLPLLGKTQAQMPETDDVSRQDAEALAEADKKKEQESAELLKKFKGRLMACGTVEELKAIGKEITPELKKGMITSDVAELREAYLEAESNLGGTKITLASCPHHSALRT